MKDQSVLLLTAEDDRFEVSPVLRLVFDADQVIAVTREVRRLIAESAESAEAAEAAPSASALPSALPSIVPSQPQYDTEDS
jgi:hypothetical protein